MAAPEVGDAGTLFAPLPAVVARLRVTGMPVPFAAVVGVNEVVGTVPAEVCGKPFSPMTGVPAAVTGKPFSPMTGVAEVAVAVFEVKSGNPFGPIGTPLEGVPAVKGTGKPFGPITTWSAVGVIIPAVSPSRGVSLGRSPTKIWPWIEEAHSTNKR